MLLALLLQNPDLVRIQGSVHDATGLPLAGATVEIDGALHGVSDQRGLFELVLSSGSRPVVRVSLPGFDAYEATHDMREAARLDVTLTISPVRDRVTVTAPIRDASPERPFEVEPLHAYRTPGAQGDLFRALQTFPGLATPDGTAGLFVRGGDVSEVMFTIDGGVIAHPYRYETPGGGFRGAVDPMLITGLSFSTGGFSARYGNALSAIVEMHGPEHPQVSEMTATVALAGASASIALPVTPGLGVRAAVNRTFTRFLFAVNGSPRHFDPPPDGWDGSGGVTWSLGRGGRIKVFGLQQHDQVGVELEQDAFVGLLRSSSGHRFASVRWDGRVGSWTAAVSVGTDTYERATRAGVLDLTIVDRATSWRLDLEPRPLAGTVWRLGANGSFVNTARSGVIPSRGGDFIGAGGTSRFESAVDDSFAGVFAEQTAMIGRVSLTAGARVDRFDDAAATTVDPRLNVRIPLGGRRALRLASGLYHQAPAASYYDRIRGALRLRPMRAIHYIVGYETGRESEGLYFRAESYVKRYTRLPLEDADRGYVSDGYGSAQGLDVFGRWLWNGVEIRGTTSWLRARRRWTPVDQQDRYELPSGTWSADFEIPWSAQLVLNVPVGRGVSAGASWRSAAGRPHTPILGGIQAVNGVLPLFGPLNSERLPRYERLDLSASWLRPAAGGAILFFASIDNALGRNNFFEFSYAPDYSSRRPVYSAAPRSFFVGMTFRR
jgi:vitamin B12 transporter